MPLIDFAALNRAAQPRLCSLLPRWLPQGNQQGAEWVASATRRRTGQAGGKHTGRFQTLKDVKPPPVSRQIRRLEEHRYQSRSDAARLLSGLGRLRKKIVDDGLPTGGLRARHAVERLRPAASSRSAE